MSAVPRPTISFHRISILDFCLLVKQFHITHVIAQQCKLQADADGREVQGVSEQVTCH